MIDAYSIFLYLMGEFKYAELTKYDLRNLFTACKAEASANIVQFV